MVKSRNTRKKIKNPDLKGELINTGQNHSPDSLKNLHYIIGIGASAGGLEALQEFFKNVPEITGMSFVIIQHLSPDYKSLMDELLARYTKLKIHKAEDGMNIEPDSIYLIPPRKNMSIFHNCLYLSDQDPTKGLNLPIDIFFRSLAKDQEQKSIGIILSGTGSDGTLGIRAIKEAGGMVMVQDDRTAKFDGMPRSSISTGMVDYILPPSKMPEELLNYAKHRGSKTTKSLEKIKTSEEIDILTKILMVLRDHTSTDFSYYKENTIIRRLEKRISINQQKSIEEYFIYLSESKRERDILYKELLIGVTQFFRDKEAFTFLNNKIIGQIITKREEKNIRIWCPACSTGEEAYSIAILFNEYILENELDVEVKIFATDIDKESIEFAGTGLYPESIINDVEMAYLNKYFIKREEGYQINEAVRRMVIFASHNILKDPPFSKIDFISCRNLFIYLKPEIQSRILSMFYFSLNSNGYLMLGTSETVGDIAEGFETVNTKWKLYKYKKGYKPETLNQIILPKITGKGKELHHFRNLNFPKPSLDNEDITNQLLSIFTPPSLLIDDKNNIIQIINDINTFINIPSGIFTRDALKVLPDELATIVSTLIRRLKKDEKDIVFKDVTTSMIPKNNTLDIIGNTFKNKKTNSSYFLISFVLSEEKRKKSTRKVEPVDIEHQYVERVSELERELQLTKESLQATVEELETSNEELQSSNEELIASNEELQSTNEELQSVNEELYTVNSEYQNKIEELTNLNNDINNLINNTNIGTLYLDRNLCIRKFTPIVTEITNIMEFDLGRPIFHLSLEYLNKGFIEKINNVIRTLRPVDFEVTDKNNKWYLTKIKPYRTEENAVDGIIITFTDITELKKSRDKLDKERKLLMDVLDNSPLGKTMVNKDGIIIYANKKARMILGITKKELNSRTYDDKKWEILDENFEPVPSEKLPFSIVCNSKSSIYGYKHYIKFKNKRKKLLSINGAPMFGENGKVDGAIFAIDDITKKE